MTPLVIILSIVGAIAVIAFISCFAKGMVSGWQNATTLRLRNVGIIAGLVCAALGVALAFTS